MASHDAAHPTRGPTRSDTPAAVPLAQGAPIDPTPFRFEERDIEEDPLACTDSSSRHQTPPDSLLSLEGRLRTISQSVAASSETFKSQHRPTLYTKHSEKPYAKGDTVKLEAISLMKVLGRRTETLPTFIGAKKFATHISRSDIVNWLNSPESDHVYSPAFLRSEKYRKAYKAAWNLPDTETRPKEKDLYPLLLAIIAAILEKFVVPQSGDGNAVERQVFDTHSVLLTPKGEHHRTAPDLAVRAMGPSFEIPADGNFIGYANIIAFFDAKVEGQISKTICLMQMAIYARQIFAHQPNRLFVRGLLISELHFRLVHFDRAGMQVTPLIDINLDAEQFVRAVVELCGVNEAKAGFDDTLEWVIQDGQKCSGTLKFKEEIYDLIHPHPISHSWDIRGRAETLWAVSDRTSDKVFIVKDSWSCEGHKSEYEHLKKTGLIKGVCKMVDYYVRDFNISRFRCNSTKALYSHRKAERIMMEPWHESPIDCFNNVLQVLRAFHDAILAHYELYGSHILHLNISNKTVMLGEEDAAEGWRGVLIDLGFALDFSPESGDSNLSEETRSGNRFFQSCMILRGLSGLTDGEVHPHDHLDELEAFFFLMCYLFFQYHSDGRPRSETDKARAVVQGWDSEKPEESLRAKNALFNPPFDEQFVAIDVVSSTWGTACGALFESYLQWVHKIQQQKAAILLTLRRRKGEQTEVGRQPTVGSMEDDESSHHAECRKDIKSKGGENGKEAQGSNPLDSDDAGCDQGSLEDEAELEDLIQSTQGQVNKSVPLKQGLFACLMDDSNEHYLTVLKFFSDAITAIETSLEGVIQHREAPSQAPKRKPDEEEAQADVPKSKRGKKG